MSKYLVETVGAASFMLFTGEYLFGHRPTIVRGSNQLSELVHDKLVKSFDSVPEEACDAEFEKFFKDHDGDAVSAVENYLASISLAQEEKAPTAKQIKANKAAEAKAAEATK